VEPRVQIVDVVPAGVNELPEADRLEGVGRKQTHSGETVPNLTPEVVIEIRAKFLERTGIGRHQFNRRVGLLVEWTVGPLNFMLSKRVWIPNMNPRDGGDVDRYRRWIGSVDQLSTDRFPVGEVIL
jgi:hypothetical protein